MKEIVEVLTIIDEKNKIFYVEYELFDKDSSEKYQAIVDMIHLKAEAQRIGYTIVRRENGLDPTFYNENGDINSNEDIDYLLKFIDGIMSSSEIKEPKKRTRKK